jgi:hypothetical protein
MSAVPWLGRNYTFITEVIICWWVVQVCPLTSCRLSQHNPHVCCTTIAGLAETTHSSQRLSSAAGWCRSVRMCTFCPSLQTTAVKLSLVLERISPFSVDCFMAINLHLCQTAEYIRWWGKPSFHIQFMSQIPPPVLSRVYLLCKWQSCLWSHMACYSLSRHQLLCVH